MAKQDLDLDGLTDDEVRQIAALATAASGSIFDDSNGMAGEQGVTSTGVRYITRTWDEHWWSPLRFLNNGRIKIWTNGDWEYYCGVDNESGHSDWDVWVDLRVRSTFNDQIIHTFATDVARVDIDHHDDPQEMRASGNSYFIQRNFDRFESRDYGFNRAHTRQRDN